VSNLWVNLAESIHFQGGNMSLIKIPWNRILFQNLEVAELLKNFPIFFGTTRFITMFTRPSHWSLSWARRIQSEWPYPVSLSFVYYGSPI
jgi:hypothetical protein